MHLFYFLIFILGTFVGSFLNILIDRIAREETVVWGNSYCEQCRHKLIWKDLIPILSYVFLRGRCRYCYAPIPFWLPLVEATTGLLFVFIAFIFSSAIFNFSLTLPYLITVIYYFTLPSLLLVIFFSDLKYHLVYNQTVYFSLGIIFIYRVLGVFLNGKAGFSYFIPYPFYNYLLSSLLAGAFFYLLSFFGPKIFHKEVMGLGDVLLSFLIGFLLGYPDFLVALYLAFFTGALVGVILVIIKKAKMTSQIPFGPFLVAATLIVWFWGEKFLGLVVGGF